MGWGVFFCKKVENGFFVKKVDLSSMQCALRTVSVFFILHFTYLGGGGVRTPLPTGLDMSRDCIPGLLEYAVA